MADLKQMKGLSEQDRKTIEQAEALRRPAGYTADQLEALNVASETAAAA